MMGFLKAVAVAVLAVFAYVAFRAYCTFQPGPANHNHRPGPCTRVDLKTTGSEDFETLSNGLTFITSGMRLKMMAPPTQDFWRRQGNKGTIYVMNLDDVKSGAKEVTITPSSGFDLDTFGPHGISVWEDKKTGRHVVFVVNHPFTEPKSSDRVEQFVYNPQQQTLVHQKTFLHPAMINLNDVQATGENSFYVTNLVSSANDLMSMVELILRLPLTNVLLCTMTKGQAVDCTAVISDIPGANGVIMSPDEQYVYVGVMFTGELGVYKRDAKNNNLSLLQKYPLRGWPDNIQVSRETNDVYVALQPGPAAFFTYADDISTRHSPSQVIRLTTKDGQVTSSQELLYDEGNFLSAASGALIRKGKMLVGSVFHSLVVCDVHVPLL